jgi:hypothetical protein
MAVLPHSYAIVNPWPLIALLRRNIAFKVVDVPFYRASWLTEEQLMTSAIGDGVWRKHAAGACPCYVHANYTWNCGADAPLRNC